MCVLVTPPPRASVIPPWIWAPETAWARAGAGLQSITMTASSPAAMVNFFIFVPPFGHPGGIRFGCDSTACCLRFATWREFFVEREDLGWVEGFEPSTSGTTIRRSTKLSYTHRVAVSP